MQIITRCLVSIVFCLGGVFAESANADDLVFEVCDNCSPSEMRLRAATYQDPTKSVNVHLVDPSNGIVKAFEVELEVEPGFINTYTYEVAPNIELVEATLKAKTLISKMRESATANEAIVDKVKELYPVNLPNHISVQSIPVDIVSTAVDVRTGNLHHLSLSEYLAKQMPIPITDKLLGLIMSSLGQVVVVVFSDNSIMLMSPKISTIRFEPLTDYIIDENGNLVDPSTGEQIGSGGDGSISGGSSGGGGGGTFLRCAVWVIISGTSADGEYCEVWVH